MAKWGQVFARQFHAAGLADIRLFDILFADPKSIPSQAASGPWKKSASAPDAVAGADVVVSAVTARLRSRRGRPLSFPDSPPAHGSGT